MRFALTEHPHSRTQNVRISPGTSENEVDVAFIASLQHRNQILLELGMIGQLQAKGVCVGLLPFWSAPGGKQIPTQLGIPALLWPLRTAVIQNPLP